MMTLKQTIDQVLRAALVQAVTAGEVGALTDPAQLNALSLVVEIPNDTTYGDYASPSALGLARLCRRSPRQIAEAIAPYCQSPNWVVSVAGAGFINFQLTPTYLAERLQDLLGQGRRYGQTQPQQPESILLEYVSANPTGPLHVGHGRWAALGSTLANLLRWAGHQVSREYYINDAGNQMQLLGRSLQVRYQQAQGETVPFPEDGYQGEYVRDLAAKLLASGETLTSLEDFTRVGYRELLGWQQATLRQLRTDFDQWFSELRLHQPDEQGRSAIDHTLQDLETKGYLYWATAPRQALEAALAANSAPSDLTDGDPVTQKEKADQAAALFFATAEFGDDKDRVVQKADGSRTYLAADIAYHRDKLARGYDRLINILGSDHHGYISRLKASVGAFGFDPERLEVVIGQFVKLFRTSEAGEREEVKMSKRSGQFVTLNDLVDDEEIGVGVDAARWFLLSNSADSTINFDLDLAVKQSNDNPVFYVQYAHTRCCSLQRLASEAGLTLPGAIALADDQGQLLFTEPEERVLLLRLLALPDLLLEAAQERAPHKVIRFTETLANDFHKFYDRCRILGTVQQEQPQLALARLALVQATQLSLGILLEEILGISAPERM